MTKRLIVSTITGAILGVVCIVGANLRFGGDLAVYFLFAFWFNRLLMGVLFGVLPPLEDWKLLVGRGIVVGLLVGFAFYSATDYFDHMGFAVSAAYGVILEFVAKKLA